MFIVLALVGVALLMLADEAAGGREPVFNPLMDTPVCKWCTVDDSGIHQAGCRRFERLWRDNPGSRQIVGCGGNDGD